VENEELAAPASPLIGAAGRLVALKGFIHLIRAVPVLRRSFPQVRLQIAGDGPELRSLQAEAARCAVQDCVEFLGWRPNLAQLFSSWQVFALPSLEEGFGISALEAMAAGLPVVASRVGGIPELVLDGITGCLVPAGDPAAIAAALSGLLADPQRRREMGRKGRERVKTKFSVAHMADSVSEIYDRLLTN
jgi:glycosyltransferase involved in cell wall biosynthesis